MTFTSDSASSTLRLPLTGWRVDCCCVDHEARLLFLYGPRGAAELDRFELVLRTTLQLRPADGYSVEIDPLGAPEGLAPLLALVRRAVITATATPEGELFVAFDDGAQLHVAPDLTLEAWALVGPRTEQLVALPAGDGYVCFSDEQLDYATSLRGIA